MSALRVMSRIICDLVCVFSGAGLEYTTGDSHSLKWIRLLPEDLKRGVLSEDGICNALEEFCERAVEEIAPPEAESGS